MRVLGYPIETVLAEKIATAIVLGAANTRTSFRGTPAAPLSAAIDDLVEQRRSTYIAYRRSLRSDGGHLPDDFGELVNAVVTFADPLVAEERWLTWSAGARRWDPSALT